MPGRTSSTPLRVRYAETDQMGVVYHGNYFAWFEVGRVELMRSLGLVYRVLEQEHGCVLPVVEVQCRYRQPARYDDELLLQTTLGALRGPMMKFRYQLFRPQGGMQVLLAEAATTHVVVDQKTLKPCRLPEHYTAALREALAPRESK
jgi:acyl-CoA thioester hydrolase